VAKISPFAFFQVLDDNGDPLAGGKLETFEAGTSVPKQTFTSADESTANANPIILDAAGRADVWLESGSYKFVLTTSEDVSVATVDDITGGASDVYASGIIDISTNTNINASFLNLVVNCTGTITLSLLDVSTAEEGFIFVVRNSGSGVITLDPDAAELIDGAATKTIQPGGSLNVNCTGTSWITTNENFGDFIKDDSSKVKISSNDTTAGDLETKLLVGAGLALSTQNDGGNETRTIDALSASETVEGIVERATDAEAATGTDTTRYTSPKQLADSAKFTYDTEVATTSGSSVTLTTSIPSNATEVLVLLNNVSQSDTNNQIRLQVGDAGGFETSGYRATIRSGSTNFALTDAIPLSDTGIDTADLMDGTIRMNLFDPAIFLWKTTGTVNRSTNNAIGVLQASKSTSQALTSIRLNLTTGTFDAGSAIVAWR